MLDIKRHFINLFFRNMMKGTSDGMNVILVFEVTFASIAAILSILSFRTLKAIRHLGVGKSFWIPVFVSGLFFFVGSIVTIFHEVNFSLTTITYEVVNVSRLLALAILVCGIYSYSRKVKESLTKKFSIPEKEESLVIEGPIEEGLETKAPIQERTVQESPKTETAPECKHQFGYLGTLPRNASIPDECLSCDKIIECKHSLVKTLESHASD